MWSMISNILLNILIAIASDTVVVAAGKKLIAKGVDSAVKGVGITNFDARDLISSITKSALNNYDAKSTNR